MRVMLLWLLVLLNVWLRILLGILRMVVRRCVSVLVGVIIMIRILILCRVISLRCIGLLACRRVRRRCCWNRRFLVLDLVLGWGLLGFTFVVVAFALSASGLGGVCGSVYTGATCVTEVDGCHVTYVAIGILTGVSAGGSYVVGSSEVHVDRALGSSCVDASGSSDPLPIGCGSAEGECATCYSTGTAGDACTEDSLTLPIVAVLDTACC